MNMINILLFFFSSRRRHTRCGRDWSSDVCSSDLRLALRAPLDHPLALVVVLVVLLLAVVEHRLDAVLVVPGDGSSCPVGVVRPAGLVAVQVVAVGPQANVVGRVRPEAVGP